MSKISVIIPVKNGAATLDKCLSNLRSQTVTYLEIIILDSRSTDNSREIACKYATKIIDIPEDSFDHGLTRNLGVQQASGDFIYLTVQDAWLAENDMLQKMALHFTDPEVMGVVGHQAVPHEEDKNPLLWYKRFSEPDITVRQVKDWNEFEKLPMEEQQAIIAWDNVVAMYRKTALAALPFVATEFAEDWIWSEQALQKGWKLVHDPAIVAWHYHHRGYRYAFRVAYALNYHFHKFLDYTPKIPAFIMPMVHATYHVAKNPLVSFKEKIYWVLHNYAGHLGTYFSHLNFLFRLKMGGEDFISRGYNKYCKTIPQGKHKK